MNTETSTYCCDLFDFDFELELQAKDQNELDFLKHRVVMDVTAEVNTPRPKRLSQAAFPEDLSS